MDNSSAKAVELKSPRGVLVFGILIIISSIIHMHTLIRGAGWYGHLYGYMPEWLLSARYIFSWAQRVLGLATGIGIICHKNLFRKLAIAIGCFTIATIYWKHPYVAFKNHAQYLDDSGFKVIVDMASDAGFKLYSMADLAMLSMVGHMVLDIVFWLILIHYMRRPAIREIFH